MKIISVSHLQKFYFSQKKDPGLRGAIQSFFFRQYEKVKAVDDISFEVKKGELLGFIGPNGAGKTTTMKCLSGLLYPDSGSVSVLSFTPFEKKEKFLKKITFVMGMKSQLWWDLPPMDSFLLNKEIYDLSKSDFDESLRELVKTLEIEDILDIPVRKLSLGQRMKCELIMSLLHRPEIMFLDEPTIGLDIVMQKKMRDFIREYNRKFGATIILTSHYMEDVKELCSRLLIIDTGKIVYDGSQENLIKKYGRQKMISVIFENWVDPKEVEKIGKIVLYEFPKAVLSVPREVSNFAASELLQKFPILDLNIEESRIEEIIREIFSKKYGQD